MDARSGETLETLGKYVQRSRLMVGIGQRLLAFRADISQSAAARLESGRGGGTPVRRLLAVSNALGRHFPLGTCPHEHRCAWQPIAPPPPLTERELIRERIIELGLDSTPRWLAD